MSPRITRLLLSLACWCFGLETAIEAQPAPAFRADRLLVRPQPGADLTALHAANGTRVLRVFPGMGGLQVLQLGEGAALESALAAYRASGLVRYAERDYVVRLQAEPNDRHYANDDLWHLKNHGQYGGTPGADIHATEAWDIQATAGNIIVAIIDTGIRLTHEDLAANLWVNPGESGPGLLGVDRRLNLLDDDQDGYIDDVHGINAVLGTGLPWDDYGHGTHVAGIVGGVGNNALGVTGVAWRVQLMACKAFDAQGNGAISDLVTCIDYARAKHANVINASWGDGGFNSQALFDAIASARDAGIIFVAAAANHNSDNDASPVYPANYPLDNIIVVAATDRLDQRAGFSNYGATTVDLAAPGTPIYSCWNGSDTDYRNYDGTSMATPQVAAACALVWAHEPTLPYGAVIARILTTVDPLPSLAGRTVSGGRLNVARALTP